MSTYDVDIVEIDIKFVKPSVSVEGGDNSIWGYLPGWLLEPTRAFEVRLIIYPIDVVFMHIDMYDIRSIFIRMFGMQVKILIIYFHVTCSEWMCSFSSTCSFFK